MQFDKISLVSNIKFEKNGLRLVNLSKPTKKKLKKNWIISVRTKGTYSKLGLRWTLIGPN